MKRHQWIFTAGVLIFYSLFGIGTLQTNAAANQTTVESTTISEASDTPDLYAKKYTVNGDTITVKATEGEDIGSALNKALAAARDLADSTGHIITVTVPNGSYMQSKSAHIYSNTTLDLTGVTLTFSGSSSFNMIAIGTSGAYKGQTNYNASSACSGYDGFANITILGGTLVSTDQNTSTIVRLFHAKNVTINGLTLKGGKCTHQMEVAAIDGFYVRNCTFQDNGKKRTDVKNHTNQEALQLDIPCWDSLYPGTYQDGTPMKNVEITGCTFKNVARGVGTHSMLKGTYHKNIVISNNTFINVVEECIVTVSYYNCQIKNNTITNCGGGILVQNYKSSAESMYSSIFTGTQQCTGHFRHNLKTVVSGNQITLRYNPTCSTGEGIKVCGYKQTKDLEGGDGVTLSAGNYYISGVTVSQNTIVTSGRGIHFLDARNCTASKNKIIGKHFSSKDHDKKYWDGIMVEQYSKNISIKNNSVSGMPRAGLMVHSSSSVKSVTSNTFSNCKGVGIQIYDSSKCVHLITKNVIKSCKRGGIYVGSNSKTASISNNKISNYNKGAGIYVCDNGSTGKITKNTIMDTRKKGKQSELPAIMLSDRASTGSITSNKITSKKAKYSSGNAIYLCDSSTVKGSISKNTIKKCSGSGIVLDGKSTVTDSISKNKISSVKSCGIDICSIRNNLTISQNKITGGNTASVYLEPESTKYNITVSRNTLTGNKKGTGIIVRNAYADLLDNKISKVVYGIDIDADSKGDVESNSFKNVSKKDILKKNKDEDTTTETTIVVQ